MQTQDWHCHGNCNNQRVETDKKMSVPVQSSESSKKPKHQAPDNDISAMTEQTKQNALGSLIPLLADFSKKCEGKGIKIISEDLCIEVTDSKTPDQAVLMKEEM